MMSLIWSHGWGFGPSFFHRVCEHLLDFSHGFLDWGYGGGGPSLSLAPSVWEERREDSPIVLIGHSLGLAKILSFPLLTPDRIAHIIGLAGFWRFCRKGPWDPHSPLDPGMDPEIMARMRAQWGKDPHGVLKTFYRRCGLTDFSLSSVPPGERPGLETFDPQILLQDLYALEALDDRPSFPFSKLSVISSTQDALSPLAHQEFLFGHLPPSQRFFISGPHAFPWICPEETAAAIRQILRRVLG